MFLRLKSCALIGAALATLASSAAAAVTTFSSQSAFNAAASGGSTFGFSIVEGFELQPNPTTLGGVTFENFLTPTNGIEGGVPLIFLIDSAFTPTYGVDFLAFQNEKTYIQSRISSAGFTAFGFTFGSYVNVRSSATLTLNTGDSFTITPTGMAQFIGFTSDTAITSVTFDYPNSFSLDILDVSTGNAVPEPATWALMIGGFGMAGAMLRRRRTVAA